MKTLKLIAALLLVPGFLFAQATNGESFGAELFAAVIVFLVILFITRGILLWYWKVNVLLEKQDQLIIEQKLTNRLLLEQNDLIKQQQRAVSGRV